MRLDNKSVWATCSPRAGELSLHVSQSALFLPHLLTLLLSLPSSSPSLSLSVSPSAIDYKLKNNEACALRGRPRKLRKSSVYLELARQVC